MSNWISNRIDQGPNDLGLAQAADETAVVVEAVRADARGDRQALIIQVDPTSTHAVAVAVGPRDASARHAVRTLLPGDEFETTGARVELQPGRVTAYSDASMDVDALDRPGLVLLNVTEITL